MASVVAANYNNAEFLDDFFNGWKHSTVWPAELIFVDDGSTDRSVQVAERHAKDLPFVKIVKLAKNVGFGNALNSGIQLAENPYIMRIDPDDVPESTRLEKQLAILDSGIADVVGSNATIFHSDSMKVVGISNFPSQHDKIAEVIKAGEHGVLHPTVMGRADLFKRNPYVQANVPAEDYDIFARMIAAGAVFHNIQEPLLRYRIHQRSASNVLPFDTIRKTYAIRDYVFGTKTPAVKVFLYFLHIKMYRKHLFSRNTLSGGVYLAAASALRPDKAFRRIARGVKEALGKSK